MDFLDKLKEIFFPSSPSFSIDIEEREPNEKYEKAKDRHLKEQIINSKITLDEVSQFKGKPFELSGEILLEYKIPYFIPTENDKFVIEKSINYLVRKIIKTNVVKDYLFEGEICSCRIIVEPYTSTRKIKKFPIQLQLNDKYGFYQLYYLQNGELGKAKITYTPNRSYGYTIDCKEFSDGVDVRRICSYPIGGGHIKELYRKNE